MTVRALALSRFLLLWLAVGFAPIAGGCRGGDSGTDVQQVVLATQSRLFEDCCHRQLPPGHHRDECVQEARRGRCHLDCRPRHDAGAPDRTPIGADAGSRDAGMTDGQGGGLDAARDAGATNCPTLTPISPNVSGDIPVGETVQLSFTAHDPGGGAQTLTVTASTTGGSVTEARTFAGDEFVTFGLANFLCTGPGTDTVTLGVANATCLTTGSVTLTCSLCGDHVLEPGEDCDPPNPTPDGAVLCDSSCHFIGTCGNGRLDPGEQCDPPKPGTCGNDCQLAVICGDGILADGEQCDPPRQGPDGLQCGANCQFLPCGNGVIDPGEACDPPKTGACDSQCQIIPSVCGNGIVQPGEQCEFPNGGLCQNCQSTTCGGCFIGHCNAGRACQALGGTDALNCLALESCLFPSGEDCAGTGTLTQCFCSDFNCSAGFDRASNVCTSQLEALGHSTDRATLVQQLNDQSSIFSQIAREYSCFVGTGCGPICAGVL